MGESIDTVSKSFGESWQLLKTQFRGLALDFGKIYLLVYVVSIIAIVLFLLLFAGLGLFSADEYGSLGAGFITKLSQNVLPIVFFGGILYVVFSILQSAIGNSAYAAVNNRTGGKKFPLLGTVRQLIMPMAAYEILMMCIALIVFGVPALLLISSFASFVESPEAFFGGFGISILLFFLFFIIWIIIAFFIQFSLPEIVLNKRGVIEAFKRSMALVRQNIVATFLFDIALIVVILTISGIFQIFFTIIQIGFVFSFIVPLMILLFILIMIVALIQSIVTGMAMTSLQYFFWKKISAPHELMVQKTHEPAVTYPPVTTKRMPATESKPQTPITPAPPRTKGAPMNKTPSKKPRKKSAKK